MENGSETERNNYFQLYMKKRESNKNMGGGNNNSNNNNNNSCRLINSAKINSNKYTYKKEGVLYKSNNNINSKKLFNFLAYNSSSSSLISKNKSTYKTQQTQKNNLQNNKNFSNLNSEINDKINKLEFRIYSTLTLINDFTDKYINSSLPKTIKEQFKKIARKKSLKSTQVHSNTAGSFIFNHNKTQPNLSMKKLANSSSNFNIRNPNKSSVFSNVKNNAKIVTKYQKRLNYSNLIYNNNTKKFNSCNKIKKNTCRNTEFVHNYNLLNAQGNNSGQNKHNKNYINLKFIGKSNNAGDIKLNNKNSSSSNNNRDINRDKLSNANSVPTFKKEGKNNIKNETRNKNSHKMFNTISIINKNKNKNKINNDILINTNKSYKTFNFKK